MTLSFDPPSSPGGEWPGRWSFNIPDGTFAGFEKLSKSLSRAAEQFFEVREAFPPNLQQLSTSDLLKACEISQDEGLPFFIVPGVGLTQELLTLEDRFARVSLLQSERDRVLASCFDAIEGIEGEIADCGAEAIEVFRQGHLRASQALSSAIVESLVIDLVRQGSVSKSELATAQAVGSIKYNQILRTITTLPLVKAYTSYRPQNDDPLPDGYSRHATIHRIDSPGVVNQDTALIALMIACSMSSSLWDIAA